MDVEMTTSRDVLDILFDQDDPVLKDFSSFLNDSVLDCVDGELNELPADDWCLDDNVLWNTFLKDTHVKDVDFHSSGNELILQKDCPDTDSASHDSDTSSPRSTCGSEITSSSSPVSTRFEMDYVNIPTVEAGKFTVTGFETSQKSPSGCITLPTHDSTITTIDIGADIIVTTSEAPADEDEIEVQFVTEIVDTNELHHPKRKKSKLQDVDDDCIHLDLSDSSELIHLSEEEKRLLNKEGVYIPQHLPLTKAEERDLKRIRRKIRNKQSAQNSRKRKKEYVDGLESRVKMCTVQNVQLQKKVQILEKQNTSLLENLKRLQGMISNSSTTTVQTSTCLMIIFLSCLLVLFPSLTPSSFESKDLVIPTARKMPVAGRSRALLYSVDPFDKGRLAESALEENKSRNADVSKIDDSSSYSTYYPAKDAPNMEIENMDTVFESPVNHFGVKSTNPPLGTEHSYLKGHNTSDPNEKVIVRSLSKEYR